MMHKDTAWIIETGEDCKGYFFRFYPDEYIASDKGQIDEAGYYHGTEPTPILYECHAADIPDEGELINLDIFHRLTWLEDGKKHVLKTVSADKFGELHYHTHIVQCLGGHWTIDGQQVNSGEIEALVDHYVDF